MLHRLCVHMLFSSSLMEIKQLFFKPLMQESSSHPVVLNFNHIFTITYCTIHFLSIWLNENETPDVTMLRGRELLICHCSLLVLDLSFSASLFYVRENKLVAHKVVIFFKSGLCALYGHCSKLRSLMDGCSRGMGTGRWIEMTYISMTAALWIARAVVGLVSTQGTEWQSEKSPLLPAAQSMHKDNRCPRAAMKGSTAWSFSRCSCITWFHHNLIICIFYLCIHWVVVI